MKIVNKKLLEKLKRKNKGNKLLLTAIDNLLGDLEGCNWKNKSDVLIHRSDADNVHSDGFIFSTLTYTEQWC